MKQPNWKVPLILSASLLALGTFAYWLEYSHKPKKEKQDTANKKPLALPSETTQIVSFRLKSASKGLIEGKCEELTQKKCGVNDASNWSITYPQTLKADSENIKSLLSSAGNMLATETIDLSEETPEKRKKLLDEYGLSDTKRTDLSTQFLELNLENGKKITAWFGTEHPLGDKTFVAASENGNLNEQTIYLISNYSKSVFDHDLTYFRDKTLFTFDRSMIESFHAKVGSNTFDALKKDGLWQINTLPGDHERIETLLTNIAQLKAKEFPIEDPTKGLKSILSYQLKNKAETFTFDLFEKNKKVNKVDQKNYYAKVSTRKEVVEVDATILSQTQKKLNDLRNGFLLSQAGKISITKVNIGGKSYHQAHDFVIGKGEPKELSTLLESMTNTRFDDFVASVPGPKSGEITFTMGDEKNPSKYRFRFSLVNQKVYAEDLNQKRKEAFLLGGTFKSALPFDETAWKLK